MLASIGDYTLDQRNLNILWVQVQGEGHQMRIEDELQQMWDRYVAVYRAGDALTCFLFFTKNGELLSPYAPRTSGRQAIELLHSSWVHEGGNNKKMTVIDAGCSEDLAWCLASFSEGEETGEGTSLCILERQPDGAWLIRSCSLNEDFPEQQG